MWQTGGLLKILEGMPLIDGQQPKWILFQAVPGGTGQNRTFDPADFADFPGYAHITHSLSAPPVADSEDHGKAQTPVLTWTRSAGGTPQTIYGMGLMWSNDAFATVCIGLMYFDFSTPLVMVDETSVIERVVTMYDDLWTHPVHA